MRRSWFGPALLASFLFCSPLPALEIIIGGDGGPEDPPPPPTEGGESEENWNPIVTCTVQPGQTILDLLLCLENEIENPPPACPQTPGGSGGGGGPIDFDEDPPDCYDYPHARSDFNVTVMMPPDFDYWGLRILLLDGSEIERGAFRENDPGIQTTRIQLNLPNRIAIFSLIDEVPTGQGSVFLTIDSQTISVTTANRTAAQINQLLQSGIQTLGYTITVKGMKVTIYNRQIFNPGIRTIQFRSTDPGIKKSSIELRADPEPVLEPPVEY